MIETPKTGDAVHHPAHYTFGRFEVIDVLMDWFPGNPLLWQVGKYIARADHKGRPVEDLKKARWYLDREIERREAIELSQEEGETEALPEIVVPQEKPAPIVISPEGISDPPPTPEFPWAVDAFYALRKELTAHPYFQEFAREKADEINMPAVENALVLAEQFFDKYVSSYFDDEIRGSEILLKHFQDWAKGKGRQL